MFNYSEVPNILEKQVKIERKKSISVILFQLLFIIVLLMLIPEHLESTNTVEAYSTMKIVYSFILFIFGLWNLYESLELYELIVNPEYWKIKKMKELEYDEIDLGD